MFTIQMKTKLRNSNCTMWPQSTSVWDFSKSNGSSALQLTTDERGKAGGTLNPFPNKMGHHLSSSNWQSLVTEGEPDSFSPCMVPPYAEFSPPKQNNWLKYLCHWTSTVPHRNGHWLSQIQLWQLCPRRAVEQGLYLGSLPTTLTLLPRSSLLIHRVTLE